VDYWTRKATAVADKPPGARRGTPALVGHLETLRPGDRVIIRDAHGNEHPRVALTGPVWGYDFAIVWVARPEVYAVLGTAALDSPDDCSPWPLEDVRRVPPPLPPSLHLVPSSLLAELNTQPPANHPLNRSTATYRRRHDDTTTTHEVTP